MEDQHLVTRFLHDSTGLVHGFGGIAEHAGGYERLVFRRFLHLGFHHAHDRARGIGEDPAADPVDAGHVHDGGDHRHVFDPHVIGRVPRRHGRHHHLGHAHGQRPHGTRSHRGTAHADDPVEKAGFIQALHDLRDTGRHGVDGLATVVALLQSVDRRTGGFGDLVPGHVRFEGGITNDARIDHQRPVTPPLDLAFDEGEFIALGIQRTYDGYGFWHGCPSCDG